MGVLALCLLGIAFAVFVHQEGEPVPVHLVAEPDQPRVPADEGGVALVGLEAAATYAADRNTRALVVGRGGHIVYEKYWDDTRFDSVVDTGFEPVLAALVVGTALNDRVVHSLDAPLSQFVPELAAPQNAFTLRGLMSRDAGGVSLEDSTDLLAMALERLTRQPYQVLVAQRVWGPLGGGDLEFQRFHGRRRDGVSAGCCLRARLGDWMRVGELLANGGVFEGNQLTPPHYMDLMLRPAHKDATRGYFTRVDGSFAAHDVAWLEGSNYQRLWVVPSLRLSILRIGGKSAKGWDEAMIPDSIIRSTSGWRPATVGEGIDPKNFAPH
jgi:CubicO group peptidase (beta-lactamase class C family)